MTDEEKKTWEDIVEQAHSEPWQSAILAADVELTILRAEVAVEKANVDTLADSCSALRTKLNEAEAEVARLRQELDAERDRHDWRLDGIDPVKRREKEE